MKDTTLAIRYAKAYIELALSRGQLEQAVEGAKAATGFFDASPEARQVLVSPLIPASDKAEALSRVLGQGVPAQAQEFVRFVIGKGRAEFLPEILRQVGVLYEGIRGIRHAEAVSAVEMTPGQVEELSVRLKALTGAEQIVLHTRLDPSLLGGVRVKVGDVVWDGSLSGRLEELKKKYL